MVESSPRRWFWSLCAGSHAHLALERIDVVEPELLAKLQDLRGAARQQQWGALALAHDRAMGAYLAACRLLVERYGEVLAVWEAAAAAGFNERLYRFVTLPTPHLVMPDILLRLEREFDRVTGMVAAAPSKPATAAQPSAANGSRPVAATNGHAEPIPTPRPRRKPKRPAAPPAEGEIAVSILRSGVELDDGTQLCIGDMANLPAAAARALVERGAADFATEV
jgi:hypothetical protein